VNEVDFGVDILNPSSSSSGREEGGGCLVEMGREEGKVEGGGEKE
jgi:hypothetical protein